MISPPVDPKPPAALRRGWCPSALRPMETGDGWLVRLHPPGATLTPAQLASIAALAGEHGNGLIEISARANLQIRGVRAQTHPALVAALLDEDLVGEHDDDGPQRLTLVSPLAGPSAQANTGDLIDAAALAGAIEARGRTIAGLPAKTLVVVDGGGSAMALNDFSADLRLLAVAAEKVAFGWPDGSWRGPVELHAAADVAAAILRGFAATCRRSPAIRRMRDLAPEALAALSGLPLTEAPPPRPAPRRAGGFALGAGRFAALVGLPFGRGDAIALTRLADAAAAHGATALRVSPWRGIAFHGLARDAAEGLLASAASLGLIVRDDDPRLSVQACAGKPACLRGQTEAMADAAILAGAMAPLLAAGRTLHVSGCVKSCARPAAADLTLVGEDGRYRVAIDGAARDATEGALDLSAIMARLRPGADIFARLENGTARP